MLADLSAALDSLLHLRKLLRRIRVAQYVVELVEVLLKDVLYARELVAVGRPLLRHLLDVLNIASFSRLRVMPQVKWTVLEPLLVRLHLVAVLFLLLLVLLLRGARLLVGG